MKELSKEIYYEDDVHEDVFSIYWDNDVVQLNKEEIKLLIPLLQNFLVR